MPHHLKSTSVEGISIYGFTVIHSVTIVKYGCSNNRNNLQKALHSERDTPRVQRFFIFVIIWFGLNYINTLNSFINLCISVAHAEKISSLLSKTSCP